MSQLVAASPTVFGGGPILAALAEISSEKKQQQRNRAGSGLAQALERHKTQDDGVKHEKVFKRHSINVDTGGGIYASAQHGVSLFQPSTTFSNVKKSSKQSSKSVPGQLNHLDLKKRTDGMTHNAHQEREQIPIKSIPHMPLSEATALLRNLHVSGWINKKGFRWFKRWQNRFVVLHGRLLKYYETMDITIGGGQKNIEPRGTIELNAHFLIMNSDIDALPFGFKIVPIAAPTNDESPLVPNMLYAELIDNVTEFHDTEGYYGNQVSSAPKAQADGEIWYFSCSSEAERDRWINALRQSVSSFFFIVIV
jgi:hypothetical protein